MEYVPGAVGCKLCAELRLEPYHEESRAGCLSQHLCCHSERNIIDSRELWSKHWRAYSVQPLKIPVKYIYVYRKKRKPNNNKKEREKNLIDEMMGKNRKDLDLKEKRTTIQGGYKKWLSIYDGGLHRPPASGVVSVSAFFNYLFKC